MHADERGWVSESLREVLGGALATDAGFPHLGVEDGEDADELERIGYLLLGEAREKRAEELR